jgi:hypothetical protein
LDKILNSQRPSSNKVGLGYDHKETNKGSKYEIHKSDKNPNTYEAKLQKRKNHLNIDSNQQIYSLSPKINEYKRNTNPKRTPQKGINNYFLATIFLIIILGIKH